MVIYPLITPDYDDWDWMELVRFVGVVEYEGYAYAYEHYSPVHRRPELAAMALDMATYREFVTAYDAQITAWVQEIDEQVLDDLTDGHAAARTAEIERRRTAPIPGLEVIAPEQARHVLRHFGAAGGWASDGFTSTLLKAIELADEHGRGLLWRGYPGYVIAMQTALVDGGITTLQTIAASDIPRSAR